MDPSLLKQCCISFRETESARTLLIYKTRDNRLSFDERLSIIKDIDSHFAPLFLEMRSDCPSLTDSDLIFCALAAEGFDTVSIAECLTISKDGVRMRKYRLRDKLTPEWFALFFPEQKRNKDGSNGSVTPNAMSSERGFITLSQKEYELLMRTRMKTKVTLGSSIRNGLKSYFKFSGRTRRSEFWYFFLFCYLVSLALGILNLIMVIPLMSKGDSLDFWSIFPLFAFDVLASIAIMIPLVSAGVRRLHDTDHSGNWLWCYFGPISLLLVFIITIFIADTQSTIQMFESDTPLMAITMVAFGLFYLLYLAGTIWLLIMLCTAGTEGPNRYGADPTVLPGTSSTESDCQDLP